MENKLKILYKDESGNLKLHQGIGKCNIYVYNDGFEPNPRFWVISKSKKFMHYFGLLTKDYYDFSDQDSYLVHYNIYNHKSIRMYKKDVDAIYDYILSNRDENGEIKWCNMINSYNNYFHIKKRSNDPLYNENDINTMLSTKLDDIRKSYKYKKYNNAISHWNEKFNTYKPYCELFITDNYEDTIYLGERLGYCDIILSNQFADHPVLTIQSNLGGFIGYVSMIYGTNFGGDKLYNFEGFLLYEFMSKRPNFHEVSHGITRSDGQSNWYFMLLDFIAFDLNLPNEVKARCAKYHDDNSMIPEFYRIEDNSIYDNKTIYELIFNINRDCIENPDKMKEIYTNT